MALFHLCVDNMKQTKIISHNKCKLIGTMSTTIGTCPWSYWNKYFIIDIKIMKASIVKYSYWWLQIYHTNPLGRYITFKRLNIKLAAISTNGCKYQDFYEHNTCVFCYNSTHQYRKGIPNNIIAYMLLQCNVSSYCTFNFKRRK